MSIPSAGYDRARMSDPLVGVNDEFHAAYDTRRNEAASDEPILVVLADELVLVTGRERVAVPSTPPAFHESKMVSHAPIALWLHGPSDRLRAFITKALPTVAPELRSILTGTLAGIDDPALDRKAFAAAMGPLLTAAIEYATKAQLAMLHARTEELLARLTAEQRRHLHVAVTGNHQARVRSLGMQYFTHRVGAERVLYAEGVEDVDAAIAIVGTQRLDRAMAAAFFGSAHRMERDLLGDAAKSILDQTDLAPIG